MATENADELTSLRTSEKAVVTAIDDLMPLIEDSHLDARLLRALTHLTGAVHHLVAAGIARYERGAVDDANDAYAAIAAVQDSEHEAPEELAGDALASDPQKPASDRPVYRAAVRWWKTGLELDIEGVGVTQSRDHSDAEAMVRDLIHRRVGVPADSFDVVWMLGTAPAETQ